MSLCCCPRCYVPSDPDTKSGSLWCRASGFVSSQHLTDEERTVFGLGIGSVQWKPQNATYTTVVYACCTLKNKKVQDSNRGKLRDVDVAYLIPIQQAFANRTVRYTRQQDIVQMMEKWPVDRPRTADTSGSLAWRIRRDRKLTTRASHWRK